jgi:hypothetical protein
MFFLYNFAAELKRKTFGLVMIKRTHHHELNKV